MQFLNAMTKEELQKLIVVIAHSSFSVVNSENLLLDYENLSSSFEFFGFENPIDKRELALNTTDYMAEFVNPVLNPIINHYESLYGKIS